MTEPDTSGSCVELAPGCRVLGYVSQARDSQVDIHAFKGVPYAVPPVAELRSLVNLTSILP